MDYNAPYGSADPNAGYVDRNTPGAVSGSRVPAAAVEMPQREIVTVIKNAGLTPNKADPTQLDQAIDQKILAATGGGGDDNYVLMTQARIRLPIFPDIQTSDGRLPVVSPSGGQVRVPTGYEFLHRGIFLVTTEQIDFATAANKIYHLRWNPTDGFSLKDLADAGYNPSAVAETNAAFDSGYDDMLVARVVTNSSNVPTITNLTNKHDLRATGELNTAMDNSEFDNDALPSQITKFRTISLNWARSPQAYLTAANDIRPDHRVVTGASSIGEFSIGVRADSRYSLALWGQGDNDIRMGWAART
ncbi:hypothetical protein [Shinella zoogloeoides]|uniref:hypothetical protein n=1 Tax=Shinella zoogloeoides TaxID=352475 RepID=UPI001F56231E|nr:hypothetical protein [Shinella zoogloeoides]